MWARAAAGKSSASQNPPPKFAHLVKGQRVMVEMDHGGKVTQLEGVIGDLSAHSVQLQMSGGGSASQVSVSWNSVLRITTRASPRHAAASATADTRLPTDNQIRSGRRSPSDNSGRQLEKFAFEGPTDTPLEKFSSEHKFDQLKTLEKMTGQRSGGFNFDEYTTKLDQESDFYKKNRRLAEALEAEIQGAKPRHVLQALDRGQKVEEELDEEELYSSVKAKSGATETEDRAVSTASPNAEAQDSAPQAKPPTPTEEEKKISDAAAAAAAAATAAAPAKLSPDAAPRPEEKPEEKKSPPEPKKPAVVSKLRASAPAFIPKSRIPPSQQVAAMTPQLPAETPYYPQQHHAHAFPQQQQFAHHPAQLHHRQMVHPGAPQYAAPPHPYHPMHQQPFPRAPNQQAGYHPYSYPPPPHHSHH